jgi:hypothetical protein
VTDDLQVRRENDHLKHLAKATVLPEPIRPPRRQTDVSIVRIILAAGAALLVLGSAVLWFVLDPGRLSRIVVSEFPSGSASGWQIAIDNRDRYVYRFDAIEERGAIPLRPWAARLSASPELRFLPAWSGKVPPGSYLFWIEGRRVLAPEIPMEGGAFADLRAFASDPTTR